MKPIANLASVSIFALLLTACGSPTENSVPPVAEENVETPQVAAPLADATSVTAPADSEFPAPLASASASRSSTSPLTPTPTSTPTASRAAAPAAAAITVASAAPKPPIFAVCDACHAVAPGQNGIGPSLAGVFNAKAGHASNHIYSDAMKNSGLTWNEATLDRYLNDPRGVVPGTTMSYAGLKNDAQRKAVIDYLKTL